MVKAYTKKLSPSPSQPMKKNPAFQDVCNLRHPCPQVNELRTRIKELSPTENIFLTATMQFRDTIKGMYSVQVSSTSFKRRKRREQSFTPLTRMSLPFIIIVGIFLYNLWPTEAPNRIQGSDEGLQKQSEHASRVKEEVWSLAGGQLVSVCAGWLYQRGGKASSFWTSQGKFENFSQSSVFKLLGENKLALDSLISLISGFFQTTKTTKKRKKDICVSCISLPALWSFCVIHPVKSSQCIVCTSSLYSPIVLWITSSAHTRWTLCSHVTCVAPTSGEWRKLTCAAVSSKGCKATKCNIKKKTQEWHN